VDAIARQEKVLAFHRRNPGSSDMEVANMLMGLAEGYLGQGMFDDALTRLEEGLGIIRRIDPGRNVREGFFLKTIEDGLAMYDKARRLYRKTVGPDSAVMGLLMVKTADTLRKLERFEKAVEKGEEGLAILRQTIGDEEDVTADALYRLAMSKEGAGDVEGAIVCLREAQGIYRKRGVWDNVSDRIDAALERLCGGA